MTKLVGMRNIRNRFTNLSNPRLSFYLLAGMRVSTLVNWLVYRALTLPYRWRALSTLTKLHSAIGTRDVLILANGPSALRLNVDELLRQQSEGELFVIVVNSFFESPMSSQFRPDLLVLSDNLHKPDAIKISTHTSGFWSSMAKENPLMVAAPLDWFPALSKDSNIPNQFVFFDDAGLEGWVKNINPARARGYGSMTAQKALALALSSKAGSIKLLGFDNSMFLGLEVDASNRIFEAAPYFFGKAKSSEMTYFIGGTADYFYFISRIFSDFKLLNKPHVVNLDPSSLVDAFRKAASDPLIGEAQNQREL
jgi:hypothetical protein